MTVTFTTSGPTPTAIAAKIGSSAFAVQALASGKLTLTIPSGTTTFAVAYVCPGQTLPGAQQTTTDEYVLEGSTADGTSFPVPCQRTGTFPTGPTATLTGSVDASAISGAVIVDVVAISADTLNLTGVANPGDFSLAAPTGTDRVQLFAYGAVQDPLQGGPILAAKNFSSQAVPGALNGGNPVVFSAADATTLEPITVTDTPAGFPAPVVAVTLETGPSGTHLSNGQGQYWALPAGALESGDYYLGFAAAFDTSTGRQVDVVSSSTSGGPIALAMPTPWSYSGPAPAALPTFQIDYSGFSGKTGIRLSGDIYWSSGSGADLQVSDIRVNATTNFQKGSTAVAIPDLSGLPGFLAAPPAGTDLSWNASETQTSFGALQTLPTNGTETVVGMTGFFTVP